jgi:AraC family transcriptional regulator
MQYPIGKLPLGQLHGKLLKRATVRGVTLAETTYSPNLKIPKHLHSCAYFCFVLQGGYREIYGQRNRECKPSTLVFHPPDESHSDIFEKSGSRCFNIQINSELFELARQHSIKFDGSVEFYGGTLIALSSKIYKEFTEMDEVSPLVIEGITMEMLAEASRRGVRHFNSKPPRWLKQAREFLDAHFSDNFTFSDVAISVGVHPVHLAREFRRRYRCTLGEYTRRLRIDFACRELAKPDSSLVEIALTSGFSSQSHFSTIFKRLTGVTPADYRARR